VISNSKLIEIPENAFGKIKFNLIAIGERCSSIKRIHPNAFSYQSKTTSELMIEARNVIPEKSSPNYFYDLVNSFENLEQLTYLSHIGMLQEKFSKNLNNLEHLTLRVDAIQGSPFSNMSKIKSLTLRSGDLNYISKNALKIGNSNESLTITLFDNKLNGSSFENGVFTPTSLNKFGMALKFSGNQIKYLEEAVFKPFLTRERNELIWLKKEPLDCDDCRSAWICKSSEARQIRQAISDTYVTCADGRNLIDCDKNFQKCK
jgi:hypothetical protein